MRIEFNWSAVSGLVDWLIEPEVVATSKKVVITPKVNKRRLPLIIRRVLPRKRESRGQRQTIALLKYNESLKRKRK